MANLKDLSVRINTLKNMQKVMRAMNMIASIKLRKLFRLQSALNLFEQSIQKMAEDIHIASKQISHPLIKGFDKINKIHVVIFTADKGLCGAHNSSIFKELDLFVNDHKSKNIAIEVTCIGKRAVSYCKKKGYTIFHQSESNEKNLSFPEIKKIASKIVNRFEKKEVQQIHIIANYFISTLHQETITARMIPFPSVETKDKKSIDVDTAIEPNINEFLKESGRLYLYYKLMSALYNSYLSEQSSRMTAMENATKNSEDLISHYAKLMNRARQANITNDLIEIISGKEALKG